MNIKMVGMRALNRDIKNLMNNSPRFKEQVRRRLGQRTKELAKSFVMPKWGSTGELKQSIVMRKETEDSTLVTAEAPYADFVELGTRPHPQPNSIIKKFREKGHPGAEPMHFMQKAWQQINREANDLIMQEVQKYFSRRRL